jgi:hypothetical protein
MRRRDNNSSSTTQHITSVTGIRHTWAAGNRTLYAGLCTAIKYIPQQFARTYVRDYCPYPPWDTARPKESYSGLAVRTAKVDYTLLVVVILSCSKHNYTKFITMDSAFSPKTFIVAVEENGKKSCACKFSQISCKYLREAMVLHDQHTHVDWSTTARFESYWAVIQQCDAVSSIESITKCITTLQPSCFRTSRSVELLDAWK